MHDLDLKNMDDLDCRKLSVNTLKMSGDCVATTQTQKPLESLGLQGQKVNTAWVCTQRDPVGFLQ